MQPVRPGRNYLSVEIKHKTQMNVSYFIILGNILTYIYHSDPESGEAVIVVSCDINKFYLQTLSPSTLY